MGLIFVFIGFLSCGGSTATNEDSSVEPSGGDSSSADDPAQSGSDAIIVVDDSASQVSINESDTDPVAALRVSQDPNTESSSRMQADEFTLSPSMLIGTWRYHNQIYEYTLEIQTNQRFQLRSRETGRIDGNLVPVVTEGRWELKPRENDTGYYLDLLFDEDGEPDQRYLIYKWKGEAGFEMAVGYTGIEVIPVE